MFIAISIFSCWGVEFYNVNESSADRWAQCVYDLQIAYWLYLHFISYSPGGTEYLNIWWPPLWIFSTYLLYENLSFDLPQKWLVISSLWHVRHVIVTFTLLSSICLQFSFLHTFNSSFSLALLLRSHLLKHESSVTLTNKFIWRTSFLSKKKSSM